MKTRKKKLNQKKNTSKMARAFYVIAVIILLFFLASSYSVTVYIVELIGEGSISLGTDWLDVLLYYINNSVMLLVYSVVIFGIGYMIQLFKKTNETEVVEAVVEEEPVELEPEFTEA